MRSAFVIVTTLFCVTFVFGTQSHALVYYECTIDSVGFSNQYQDALYYVVVLRDSNKNLIMHQPDGNPWFVIPAAAPGAKVLYSTLVAAHLTNRTVLVRFHDDMRIDSIVEINILSKQ